MNTVVKDIAKKYIIQMIEIYEFTKAQGNPKTVFSSTDFSPFSTDSTYNSNAFDYLANIGVIIRKNSIMDTITLNYDKAKKYLDILNNAN